MKKAIYHYTYFKNYVFAGNYRWQCRPLPSYLQILIEREGSSAQLYVLSTIHINKKVAVGCSYVASSFTDTEIIKDQTANIYSRFIN